MKKTIILIILTYVISQSIFSQKKFDPKQLSLSGSIKSIVEIDYSDISNKKIAGPILRSWFNKEGKIVKYNIYNSQDELLSTKSYFYDTAGNDSIRKFENSKKNIYVTTIFKIEENGNLISEQSSRSDSQLKGEIIYKFDEARNLISALHYAKKDSIRFEILNTYDKYNQLIENKWLNINKNVFRKRTYKYKRNLLRQEIHSIGEELFSKIDFKYNCHKKVKVANQYFYKDSSNTRTFYQYNKNGMVIKETIKKQNGEISYYTFQYDDQNNWVELKYFTHKNNKEEFVMTKEFEYY